MLKEKSFDQKLKEDPHMEFRPFLCELVKILEVDTYVELGVQSGYTFNKISPIVKRAVAVDINPLPDVILNSNVEISIMSTNDFSKVWKDPIDFLFIDANHSKEQVLQDFFSFSSFVVEETGMVAFHDACPAFPELLQDYYCSDAWKAIWEMKTNLDFIRQFEVLTIPSSWCGLTLIRKSNKQLWWK